MRARRVNNAYHVSWTHMQTRDYWGNVFVEEAQCEPQQPSWPADWSSWASLNHPSYPNPPTKGASCPPRRILLWPIAPRLNLLPNGRARGVNRPPCTANMWDGTNRSLVTKVLVYEIDEHWPQQWRKEKGKRSNFIERLLSLMSETCKYHVPLIVWYSQNVCNKCF